MSIKQLRSNYHAPTPYKLKVLADFVLVIQVAISGAIPSLPLTDVQKMWAMFALNIIGVTFKFITKFMSDEPKKSDPTNSDIADPAN